MEVIEKIEECTFNPTPERKYNTFDGYRITTDKQTILVGIGNRQDCCEHWGYVTSEDNLDDFVGAQLGNVRVTDTALNTAIESAIGNLDKYEGSCMFVTFETSEGDFQFVAYNEHNGYYGHEAVVISTQVTDSEWL
jgi:hypothetical protein